MMHFVLQTPSLQHLAGVKIVAHLWTQKDIFTKIAQSYNRLPVNEIRQEANCGFFRRTIDEKVKSKVCALPLPQLCKNQLLNLIKPLGMEIIIWCCHHCDARINFQFLDNVSPQQVCWTMHGSVDYAKTAQSMAKDERVDVEKRFKLACINCLEDQAQELFQYMGEERRLEFVNRVIHLYGIDDHHLVVFFTCALSGHVAHLRKYFSTFLNYSSMNKYLFDEMLRSGNGTTCEYLFKKLNRREKEQVLELCVAMVMNHRYFAPTRITLYFLSLLNEEQQERVFRECSADLLKHLLHWPMQSLFMEFAQGGWQLMDNRARIELLLAVIEKIRDGFRDYDYCQLFWECWRLTLAECIKQHFLSNHRLMGELLLSKQEEFVKLVVNEGSLRFMSDLINFDSYRNIIIDESSISDAALTECKQAAALNSEKEPEDEEKRLRSEYLSRLGDLVMEERMKRRRL